MRLHAAARVTGIDGLVLGRVSNTPGPTTIYYGRTPPPNDGRGYLAVLTESDAPAPVGLPWAAGVRTLDYLAEGDVVSLDAAGLVRVLYRKASPHNFILMTEQCNSYCLMCSQPPRTVDDRNRIAAHLRLIDLIDPATADLGITGGEPTLFKDDFLRLIRHAKERLPRTALHVLTNGRLFYYRRFAESLGAINHPDLMLGIPLYAADDSTHDYIVQARGAFEETVIGLHHLAHHGVPIEIRVVLNRQTILGLERLAAYIARNLPFVSHVALMGLEPFGFVHQNADTLWIDPTDYATELREAVETLTLSGLRVSIYNHQLCVLPESLWPFARRSISDWKNVYLPECDPCTLRSECGGFFASGVKRHSAAIRPRVGQSSLSAE
jgi:His-Xaa-Ser system radical SAM maturase HxsC